jgi:hypothetical protein
MVERVSEVSSRVKTSIIRLVSDTFLPLEIETHNEMLQTTVPIALTTIVIQIVLSAYLLPNQTAEAILISITAKVTLKLVEKLKSKTKENLKLKLKKRE